MDHAFRIWLLELNQIGYKSEKWQGYINLLTCHLQTFLTFMYFSSQD